MTRRSKRTSKPADTSKGKDNAGESLNDRLRQLGDEFLDENVPAALLDVLRRALPPGQADLERSSLLKEAMMPLGVNETIGYSILAENGDEVGTVDDLLFDDASSAVRYLVINAGGWLYERMVLLSPAAFGAPDQEGGILQTALTKQQVEDSPAIDTEKPVSRQQEAALHGHFGWTPYWDSPIALGIGGAYWGAMPVIPKSETDAVANDMALRADTAGGDPHLRSAREVIGYYIGAKDGDIGHVDDLLIHEKDWTIRYLVIDTRNWLPGKKVLVPTNWLHAVDWHEQKIEVDLDRDKIKSSPEYDRSMILDQDFHESLHHHYGRSTAHSD